MRAILVGPPGVRDRLRWDLETRSIEVVGEFDTIVDARRAGLDADIVVSAPSPRDSGSGTRDSGTDGDRGRVFEEALTPVNSRSSNCSPRDCPTRASLIAWGSATRP